MEYRSWKVGTNVKRVRVILAISHDDRIEYYHGSAEVLMIEMDEGRYTSTVNWSGTPAVTFVKEAKKVIDT